ncbi:MAG: MarR family transcriptional regulator [Peptococcaceae bacterium]|nr:MarR family transcriptional regulator [Peptococcaceae bacterium]
MEQRSDLEQARALFTQAIGRQFEFWGFGRVFGRLWALLYLYDGKLTLDEMAAALKVSKATVSMQVRRLERFGMVRRHVRPGDRKDYYEAETDFGKMVKTILRQREKEEFDATFDLVNRSIALVQQAKGAEDRDFVLDRLQYIKRHFDLLDRIVEAILTLDRSGLAGLAAMLQTVRKAKTQDKAEGE